MGDRRHHASEDGEALFRLLQVQAGFYIFILGSVRRSRKIYPDIRQLKAAVCTEFERLIVY